MALSIIVTDAGRAALINAANNGTNPVVIAQAGISATAVVPSAAATALPDEIKRLNTIAGDVVADDMIHLIVRDEGGDSFTVRSFGLYLADGTLFAIYGQAGPILEKSAQAMMLLAVDITFADVDAAEISFGDTNFLNPPATETVQGVVELATPAETIAGVDITRAAHPKGIKDAVTSWLNARFGEGAPSAFMKGLLTTASAAALRVALGLKNAALKDEGAGNGLDADLLDGQQGNYYTNITARLGYTPWGPSNDGAGSGLDADLLDGQHGSYYTNIPARLGYTPLNAAGGTMTGKLILQSSVPWITFEETDFAKQWHVIADGATFTVREDTSAGANTRLTISPGSARLALGATLQWGSETVWHSGNDGSGSGLDADMLDGQHGSYYTDIVARLGYAPLNKAGDTMTASVEGADLLSLTSPTGLISLRPDAQNGHVLRIGGTGAKSSYLQIRGAGETVILDISTSFFTYKGQPVFHAGNDGSGSGLDADLLDGHHASAFDRITSENIAAINGYMVHANGLKECWTTLTVPADGTVSWPLPVAHSSWVNPVISMSIQNGELNAQQTVGVVSATLTHITIFSAVNYTTAIRVQTKGV